MLDVRHLSIHFHRYNQGLRRTILTPVVDLDLQVRGGEIVAVVGSSGSGKSLLVHAVLGILPSNAQVEGEIWYQGQLLTPERQAILRGRQIALIPQSVSFLDPLMRVGAQVRRAAHLSGKNRHSVDAQRAIFQRYQLPPEAENWYPFQLSGGMARRTLVAMAVVGEAELLLADEPTPGLHPEVVQETLNHLRQLADEGRGVVLITHDIQAALQVADRIAVFYAGTTVEIAPRTAFSGKGEGLLHPYTQALWRSLPQNEFVALPGMQPSPQDLPAGCLFAPRCPLATSECSLERPAMRTLAQNQVRCIHAQG
ncbi:MAG: Dipeptide transport ATP-binding protein DppD [Anaerolineae bacterium]|jgi:peptide/nickel transport system ATP-binding protein|nr:MAG: Dipeptide transport ATP-binding protein DppD [Anaerolineae bacterium]